MVLPCAGRTGLFFDPDPIAVARAKRLCAACTRRIECAASALANDEQDGVWGGLTITELRAAVDDLRAQRGPTPR